MRSISLLPAFALIGGTAGAQTMPTPPPAAPPPAVTTYQSSAPPPVTWLGDRRPFSGDATLPFATSRRYIAAYQQVLSYGRCVAHTVPAVAAGVLAADPNSADERQELSRLYGVGRACLPYGYRPPVIFIRGGLAEALFNRAAPAAGPPTPARLAAFEAGERARSHARLFDDRQYANLADCLAVRAPSQVRGLLLSEHGSEAERAAIDAVLAAAPGCGGMKRLPTAGARPFLRAYVAESAWRWAEAARPA